MRKNLIYMLLLLPIVLVSCLDDKNETEVKEYNEALVTAMTFSKNVWQRPSSQSSPAPIRAAFTTLIRSDSARVLTL